MVKLLLEFKFKLDACLAKAFQNNEMFRNAQKEAFEHFINQVTAHITPGSEPVSCRLHLLLVLS